MEIFAGGTYICWSKTQNNGHHQAAFFSPSLGLFLFHPSQSLSPVCVCRFHKQHQNT